ncbi:MAG: 30S ribosomal protein S5 [Fimbriimonadales bacterium]|nr:30S ribosomal protein S5 [Fimbriimonadales bacterium]
MGGDRNLEGQVLEVRVIQTNRVSKTHKGGKTPSWSVLVVAGDKNGHVGAAIGKALGVPEAIRKGEESAKKNLISVPMVGGTIPHAVVGREGTTRVLLRPASPGTGLVAGGAVRAILELAGVHDVLAKTLGSRNAVNCAWATLKALSSLVDPASRARERGKDLKELAPWYCDSAKEKAEEPALREIPSPEDVVAEEEIEAAGEIG